MNSKINLVPLKYNQTWAIPPYNEITDVGEVVLPGPDNAVLLLIEPNDDITFHVLPGNTVLSGGKMTYELSAEEDTFIFLECGPFVYHNSDGTDSIRFEVENGTCSMAVFQLI